MKNQLKGVYCSSLTITSKPVFFTDNNFTPPQQKKVTIVTKSLNFPTKMSPQLHFSPDKL